MHPTRRLFSIIQFLRSARHPVRASQLADDLEVSVRTIYRDIAELQAQGVPIMGEAGVGYVLQDGYQMPPLMLTSDEMEAALLGAKWVLKNGDDKLASGARSLLTKLDNVVPDPLKNILDKDALALGIEPQVPPHTIQLSDLRQAIHARKKITIHYLDLQDRTSVRTVWPFMLVYFDSVRLLVAWCETRQAFRHFRTDRIEQAATLDTRYPKTIDQLKSLWWAQERKKMSKSDPCP